MSLHAILQAFATVFPAELPDKSMVATIVLVTRYRRPAMVWIGVVAAFGVHVVIAVAAGSVLGLLPETVVQVVVGLLFALGAVVLLRAARRSRIEEEAAELQATARTANAVVGSFALVALAEWGDLTQLATASLAARSGEPASTGLGALLALAAVAGLAATVGRHLVTRVRLERVNYVGAAVFAGLAAWTVAELTL